MSALHDYEWLQREAEMQRAGRLHRALDRDAEFDRARLEQPHSEDAEYAVLLYALYGIAVAVMFVIPVLAGIGVPWAQHALHAVFGWVWSR